MVKVYIENYAYNVNVDIIGESLVKQKLLTGAVVSSRKSNMILYQLNVHRILVKMKILKGVRRNLM